VLRPGRINIVAALLVFMKGSLIYFLDAFVACIQIVKAELVLYMITLQPVIFLMTVDYLDGFNLGVVEFCLTMILLIAALLFALGWPLMANLIEGK
jgi:hypothetical protein